MRYVKIEKGGGGGKKKGYRPKKRKGRPNPPPPSPKQQPQPTSNPLFQYIQNPKTGSSSIKKMLNTRIRGSKGNVNYGKLLPFTFITIRLKDALN